MLGHRPLTRDDYMTILKRRSWIVAIPAIVFPIIAFACSYLLSPQYISQTLVLIEQQRVPEKYVMPVVTEDLNARLASMKEQITSRSRLQPIIEKYNLYSGMSMDDRITAAQKNIDIKLIQSEIARSGGLPGFYISFKASDARTAQLVCADITSLFVNQNSTDREVSAQGTTAFLQQQLTDAKRNLDEQDAKLAKFQQSNAGRLPEQDTSNMNMLQSLNTQLDAATQQINRMEQDLSYEQAMLAQQSRDLGPTTSSVAEPHVAPAAQQLELQNLLAQEADLTNRYTADYPDVVAVRRKIADLRKQMSQTTATPAATPGTPAAPRSEPLAMQQLRASIRAMEQGIAQKRKDQAGIQGQIHEYQGRLSSSPLVQQEYATITRDHQTSQQFYDELLKQSEQAKMAVDLERRQQGEQFRIMDEPNLPDSPAFPKRGVFAAGGLLLGLFFGVGIIALLEYRDTAIRSERDIWEFTKLPTLAVLSLNEAAEKASTFSKPSRLRFWRRGKPSGAAPSKPLSAGA